MEHEEISDWECVQKVQSGDANAFAVLVQRHERRIFNLLYRWLGNYEEAADVGQDVFLAAFRAIKRFRGESSFGTWLYRIGVNHAKNRQKGLALARKRREEAEHSDPPDASTSDPAEEVEQREIHEFVQLGLNDLPDDDALIIVLHDLQEVRYEEIATMLDVPLGTVKSRLHRARLALKDKLSSRFGRKKWP